MPELLVILVIIVTSVAPLYRILQRAGLPPLISLAAFIPPVGIIVLWYVALARWPAVERNA
ncbi:MAG TPA: hypothetical protein VJZ76_21210 [Thermoanaerobaculia bacterium]|nr:hypothetical protein [Thermoanaerobaculia bacterium]